MSNLLRKASIITTPTAYAEDFLYNIKPTGGLGDERITNGTFDTDSNWTKGTGWSIANGKATVTSSITDSIYQDALTLGKTFKVTFEITNITSGSLRIGIGINFSDYFTQVGTYTFYGQPSNDTLLRINPSSGTNASIDNVSVKEVADFDFDRNSTGTRVNEDYLIEDVPYNLVPQSNQFDTTWTKTNVTLTGGQSGYYNISDAWKIDISSAFAQVEQAVSTSGVQTFSVYAKAGTLNFIRLRVDHTSFSGTYFDLQNGVIGSTVDTTNASMQNVGGGWYRCSISFVNNITRVRIYPAIANNDLTATSGNIFIQNAQLVKGDQPKDYLKTTDRLDIPRIDYTNGEPSILLEPSRTNEILHSNQFDTTWSTGFSTITGNSGISPSGINNAWKVESTTVGAETRVRQSHTFSIGESVTISCFMKAGTVNFGIVRCYAISGGGRAWFNLSNGTVGTENSGITGSIQEYPNGWYRCVISFTTDQSGAIDIAPAPADNDYLANAIGENILIYGAQLETGSYATSLIHTSGSAVTRSADAATNAGNSDLFNDSEGVFYVEVKHEAQHTAFKEISISDGTMDNRITFYNPNASDALGVSVVSSGSVVVNDYVSGVDLYSFSKYALLYKQNDFKVYVNGELKFTDTSGNTPTGLSQVQFAKGDPTGSYFYGNAKMVAVFKEALSDEELACLTSPNNNEIFLNYYNRMQYVNATTEAMGCAQKTYTI